MSSLNKKGCGFFPRLAKASLYFFLLGGGGEKIRKKIVEFGEPYTNISFFGVMFFHLIRMKKLKIQT